MCSLMDVFQSVQIKLIKLSKYSDTNIEKLSTALDPARESVRSGWGGVDQSAKSARVRERQHVLAQ